MITGEGIEKSEERKKFRLRIIGITVVWIGGHTSRGSMVEGKVKMKSP